MSSRHPTKPSSSSHKPSTSASKPSTTKTSTTVSKSSQGTLVPKLDKTKAPSSSSSSTHRPGIAMPKLDKTKAPTKSGYGTEMPKLDKTRFSSSSRVAQSSSARPGVTRMPTVSERPSSSTRYESSSTRLDSSSTRNAPSSRIGSTLHSNRDQTMASRQLKITSMSVQERQEQEQWAQEQLKENAGSCAAGFDWQRSDGVWPGYNGYQCKGTNHFVTDELLARGLGQCYISIRDRDNTGPNIIDWEGPYTIQEIADELGVTVVQYKAHMAKMKAMVDQQGVLGQADPMAALTNAMANQGFQQGFYPGQMAPRFPPGGGYFPGPRYGPYGGQRYDHFGRPI